MTEQQVCPCCNSHVLLSGPPNRHICSHCSWQEELPKQDKRQQVAKQLEECPKCFSKNLILEYSSKFSFIYCKECNSVV